jgi:hypothetical protein
MRRSLVALVLLALVAAAGTALRAGSAAAVVSSDTWTVRLYSGGEVVGTWEALDLGRVEGESLVFPVEDGVGTRQVRIAGTWSVAPKE